MKGLPIYLAIAFTAAVSAVATFFGVHWCAEETAATLGTALAAIAPARILTARWLVRFSHRACTCGHEHVRGSSEAPAGSTERA